MHLKAEESKKFILYSKEALFLNKIPGTIGIEFASFFNKKYKIIFKFEIVNINSEKKTITIKKFDAKKENFENITLEASNLLVAIGIEGNIENLKAQNENFDIEIENNFIKIDMFCQTNIEGIFSNRRYLWLFKFGS